MTPTLDAALYLLDALTSALHEIKRDSRDKNELSRALNESRQRIAELEAEAEMPREERSGGVPDVMALDLQRQLDGAHAQIAELTEKLKVYTDIKHVPMPVMTEEQVLQQRLTALGYVIPPEETERRRQETAE
jgi:hypothetical protein